MAGGDHKTAERPGATEDEVPDGDAGVARFHPELYRIARRELRRMARSGTIDTVALVNEAYLRVQHAASEWSSRGHFLASMTTIMRHILVDHARERASQRRGGDWLRVTTSGLNRLKGQDSPVDVIALDTALNELGTLSPRLEQVVELKVFGGLTINEMAAALDISTSTVSRDLRVAAAFLQHALARGT